MMEEKTQHFESCVQRIRVDSLAYGLNSLFNRKIEIPRMRYGKKQTPDTLINEEACLLVMFLRNERQLWDPELPLIDN